MNRASDKKAARAVCGLAALLAVALTSGALAGGDEAPLPLDMHLNEPIPHKQPRWSNDDHIMADVEARDCVGAPHGYGPDYVPGEDAWGRPVVELIKPYADRRVMPLPYGEIDFNLYLRPKGRWHRRGVELRIEPNDLWAEESRYAGRDCLSRFK